MREHRLIKKEYEMKYSTDIQMFDFHNHEVRVLTDSNGEPWFVGKDVAAILGYSDVNKAVAMHVDSEDKKLNDKTSSSFGQRGATLINESGLYSLILSSKLPTAREFKRWVTHDVLPSIRKHGAYMTEQTVERILSNPDTLIRLATDLKHEREARKQAEQQVKVLAPKAQALDDFTSVEGTRSVRDTAKILRNNGVRVTEKQLWQWMADNGWIFRSEGHWVAYARVLDNDWLWMREYETSGTRSNGERFAYPQQVRITRKGMEALHRKLFTFEDSLFDNVDDAEDMEELDNA